MMLPATNFLDTEVAAALEDVIKVVFGALTQRVVISAQYFDRKDMLTTLLTISWLLPGRIAYLNIPLLLGMSFRIYSYFFLFGPTE
jgi:hypothetical protein